MSSSLPKTHCTVLFLHNTFWSWEQVGLFFFLNPVFNKCWWMKIQMSKMMQHFFSCSCLGRATCLQQGFEVSCQEISLGAALPPSTHTWIGGPQWISGTCYRAGAHQGLCGPLVREVRITSYAVFVLSILSQGICSKNQESAATLWDAGTAQAFCKQKE